jgi:hypothetical protein
MHKEGIPMVTHGRRKLIMWISDEIKVQEIIHALSDENSRKIIVATISEGKSPEQIIADQGIPPSTCYKRIHELASRSILRISKIELVNGRKMVYYKCAYKNLSVKLESEHLVIDAAFNTASPEEKLVGMLSDMKNTTDLSHENANVFLHDCDLCQLKQVPCTPCAVGDSGTQVLACYNCREKVRGEPILVTT